MCDQISEYHDLVKFTHKINYHNTSQYFKPQEVKLINLQGTTYQYKSTIKGRLPYLSLNKNNRYETKNQ